MDAVLGQSLHMIEEKTDLVVAGLLAVVDEIVDINQTHNGNDGYTVVSC